MSYSDDTDDLLLIPPDFFVVSSEPEPPYYCIVDHLIKQVSNLQERIEDIEFMSDASLTSYSNNNNNNPRDIHQVQTMYRPKSEKKYFSYDDLYHQPAINNSTQSTPQKNHRKVELNSLPNSPNVKFNSKKFSVKFHSPQEENAETFISNVKNIQRNHAVRNLENAFNDNNSKKTPASKNQNKFEKDLKKTTEQLDRQSEKLTIHSNKNSNKDFTEPVNKVEFWKCCEGENAKDYGFGHEIPELNIVKHKTAFEHNSATTDLSSTMEKSSDSSSESTQLTAYHKINTVRENFSRKKYDTFIPMERDELLESPVHDNAISVLNIHKKLMESSTADSKLPKNRGINTLNDNLKLMSLADIWGINNSTTNSPSKLNQKIQEEKMRRHHCEELIQDLHSKNLELQQKVTVALKVDEAKNNTIEEFREALKDLSKKLQQINEEKLIWDRENVKLKNQYSIEHESANQKISYYEKEATRCLNLVHENNDKISSLEKRCSDLQKEIEQFELKFKELEDKYKSEAVKNNKLADIISQKEIELKENKTVLHNAREEVSHSRKAVEICQAEFTDLKNECARFEAEIKENKKIIFTQHEEAKKFCNEIQSYKLKEKHLRDELEKSKIKQDNIKLELRNFYQGQLEIIVDNKRKEMQNQMDQERKNNLEEMRKKELSMAKTAANHIKEITDKCTLETKLLEEKYQEEIRLYQMQLTQKDQKIEHLQRKLAQFPEKRAEIAKQLQKAMENQWNEALKTIISGTSTPNNYQTVATINDTKKSSNNAEIKMGNHQFGNPSEYDETPVSSRESNRQSESEIQKYINMLLNRPPGNPINEPENRIPQQSSSAWSNNNNDDPDNINQHNYEKYKIKPPWK